MPAHPETAPQAHWQQVYGSKQPDEVSWYAPHLATSLARILAACTDKAAPILDVGGGASTLVDDLLDAGYTAVHVLDISPQCLAASQHRLGARAAQVQWHVADITQAALPPQHFAFWHDRAVFHFLTDATDRAAYVGQAERALLPGGHIVVATFGPDGPQRCSGLPVCRYDADGLHSVFGAAFAPLDHQLETHQTPWGAPQEFLYCACLRRR